MPPTSINSLPDFLSSKLNTELRGAGIRAGILNLGIEGIMMLSAMSGFPLLPYFSGSLWLDVLAAILTGMLAGLIMGFLTVSPRLTSMHYMHNCLSSQDMPKIAHMGLHVAQMTGVSQMRQMFAAVTENGAKVLGLEGYGLNPGCNADLFILQAADPVEALRLEPACLFVIRRGRVIAETQPAVSRLLLNGRSVEVDFSHSIDHGQGNSRTCADACHLSFVIGHLSFVTNYQLPMTNAQ